MADMSQEMIDKFMKQIEENPEMLNAKPRTIKNWYVCKWCQEVQRFDVNIKNNRYVAGNRSVPEKEDDKFRKKEEPKYTYIRKTYFKDLFCKNDTFEKTANILTLNRNSGCNHCFISIYDALMETLRTRSDLTEEQRNKLYEYIKKADADKGE